MIAVVGMARSGLAAARLLRARGLEVWATDSDPDPSLRREFEALGIPCQTGAHSGERLREADEIVLSPGVPPDIEPVASARQAGVPIVGELEVAARFLTGDVVAITGSNGKTTTTALAAHILSRGDRPVQVGGNIGRPVSDLVASATPSTINVVEVSSFQLEATREFRPRVSVLLNVTPDHMDRYADFDAYRMTKFALFQNQEEGDVAILNRDDAQVFPLPVAIRASQRWFGLGPRGDGGGISEGKLTVDGKAIMSVGEVRLRGAHNLQNVLAALLVADFYKIDQTDLQDAVTSFDPVEHRLETVATIRGVEYVNDSKATNVDSAVKAIEAFSNPIVLIAGGVDKGARFEPLAAALRGRVRQVITIGVAGPRIREAVEEVVSVEVPVLSAGSMAEAVSTARRLACPGDVVLLAPACASFDMYENYEERGRAFRDAVLAGMQVAT